MKNIICGLIGFCIVSLASFSSAETFSELGTLSAVRAGFGPSRTTKIAIKAKEGWTINTKYNLYIRLDDKTLVRSDATFKDVDGDKAKEVIFSTKSTSSFGIAKLVFCNDRVCTQPTTSNFTILEK